MTEAQRAWYIANRERELEKSRDRYAANRERVLERRRERYLQNRDSINEYQRAYYARNREGWRRRYRENREEKLEYERLRREQNRDAYRTRDHDYYLRNRDKIQAKARPRRMWTDHGLLPEQWIALWEAQGGLCYLCGDAMIDDAVIDHDHSCCPADRSCRRCRRGLAHARCNCAIGFAQDNPDQLRNMADALETAQLEVDHRRSAADAVEQLLLIE